MANLHESNGWAIIKCGWNTANRIFWQGGKGKHWPVALSQTLLCVVEMRLFFMKCINEKTKRLSSERMMLCIDVVYESLCIQHTQIAL